MSAGDGIGWPRTSARSAPPCRKLSALCGRLRGTGYGERGACRPRAALGRGTSGLGKRLADSRQRTGAAAEMGTGDGRNTDDGRGLRRGGPARPHETGSRSEVADRGTARRCDRDHRPRSRGRAGPTGRGSGNAQRQSDRVGRTGRPAGDETRNHADIESIRSLVGRGFSNFHTSKSLHKEDTMLVSRNSLPSLAACRAIGVGLILAGWFVFCVPSARGADEKRIDGHAPPNMAILKNTRNGVWFVAKGLKEQYDRLIEQARALQADLEREGLSAPEARQRISGLRRELEKLRMEIERKKLLISPFKVHTQNETTLFDLGPEKLLVVTGDNIVVEGWDGLQVKCVFEKTVLEAGDDPR